MCPRLQLLIVSTSPVTARQSPESLLAIQALPLGFTQACIALLFPTPSPVSLGDSHTLRTVPPHTPLPAGADGGLSPPCSLHPGSPPLSLFVLGDDHILGGGGPAPRPCSPSSCSGPGHPLPTCLHRTPSCPCPVPPSPRAPCPVWGEGLASGRSRTPAPWCLSPVPSLASSRNAVCSTPRGFASPVSRRTWMPSLRKSGKTWRKGKLHRRGRPAGLALGHERGRVPGWQQHLAQSSRASRAPAAWVWDGAELGAVVPSLVPGQKQHVQPEQARAQPAAGR